MAKQVKKVYRLLAWFFSAVVAAGTLMGCGGHAGSKYGPPPSDSAKYGPPAYNSPKSNSKMAAGPTDNIILKEDERAQEV